MNPFLALRAVRKSFDRQEVLVDVSVSIREGEVLALLGPSGSGKTTLLRVIAGFETLDAGTVEVAGRDVASLPPARRRFGMVFQHYALFPHLTVGENVGFGLESEVRSKVELRERVEGALARVDLGGFAERRIHEISGGQQQRVALARALAPGPRLLLLDEPLSNLDPTLRERTRSELRRVIGDIGITAVWVTHEQEEAFHVGDVVAVLNQGRLQQAGPPAEIYRRPANRFVAGFVGRASWLAGRREGAATVAVEVGGRRLIAPVVAAADAGERAAATDDTADAPADDLAVDLLLRPEQLVLLDPQGAAAGGSLPGVIVGRRFAGAVTLYRVLLGGTAGSQEHDAVSEIEVVDADPGRSLGSACAIALRDGERAVAFAPAREA